MARNSIFLYLMLHRKRRKCHLSLLFLVLFSARWMQLGLNPGSLASCPSNNCLWHVLTSQTPVREGFGSSPDSIDLHDKTKYLQVYKGSSDLPPIAYQVNYFYLHLLLIILTRPMFCDLFFRMHERMRFFFLLWMMFTNQWSSRRSFATALAWLWHHEKSPNDKSFKQKMYTSPYE